jgi:hypothetical protein
MPKVESVDTKRRRGRTKRQAGSLCAENVFVSFASFALTLCFFLLLACGWIFITGNRMSGRVSSKVLLALAIVTAALGAFQLKATQEAYPYGAWLILPLVLVITLRAMRRKQPGAKRWPRSPRSIARCFRRRAPTASFMRS